LRLALVLAGGIALGSCNGYTNFNASIGGVVTPTSFYLSGPAGVDRGVGGSIPFFGNPPSANGLALLAINLNGTAQTSIAPGGTWLNQAAVAQWTAAAGSATMAGIRYRVWAGVDGALHRSDLGVTGGSSAPATTTLSTLNLNTGLVCPGPAAFNDLATPDNSFLVYRVPGITVPDCGSADDRFTVIALSASATTAPGAISYNEPVDVARDATGAVNAVLVIAHSTTYDGSGNPINPAVVQVANAAFTPTATIGPLTGNGLSASGGDFQSLAVVLQANGSWVWLYRDTKFIVAVSLLNPTVQTTVYTALDTDTIQGPAVVDGSNAYVALTDTTGTTNRIVAINTSSFSAGSGTVLVNENSTGLQLVGVAGSQLVYFINSGSVLRTVAKTGTNNTAGTIVTATAPSALDPAPVIVGSGLFYTVTSPTAPLAQAYYFNGIGGTAISTGFGSRVLGGVAASPMATANPGAPAYASALIALLSSSNSAASLYSGATIASYGTGGAPGASYGVLPAPRSGNYASATLSEGPLQAGMPALLIVGGNAVVNQSSFPAGDLFVFTPGTAASLAASTNNIQ